MTTLLLLIPGMMCDERIWGEVPKALGHHRIIHALPIGGENIETIAADILQQAPPQFALAGLSMGGIVAMEILAKAPQRVERVALLDTNPRAETASVQARRLPQIERVFSEGLEQVMRNEIMPNYLHSHAQNEELLKLCLDMALSLGPEIFKQQSLALRDRQDRQAALANFTRPALVLTGEDDRLCPLDRHELMHNLMPQSRLAVIAGAGHLPTLERPEQTIAALRSWLEAP